LSKRNVTVKIMGKLVNEIAELNASVQKHLSMLVMHIAQTHDGSLKPRAATAALASTAANLGCSLGRSTYVLDILQSIEPNHPEIYQAARLNEGVDTALNDDLSALNLVSADIRGVRMSGLGASRSQPKYGSQRASFAQRRGAALDFERLLTVGGELLLGVEADLAAVITGVFEDVPASAPFAAWLYGMAAFCHADRIGNDTKIPAKLLADMKAADVAVGVVTKTQWSRVVVMSVEARSALPRSVRRPQLTVVRSRPSTQRSSR
jgi:hypothetical protein